MGYQFLFNLALILLSTKLFGMLTRKFKMPQVVGALAAGLILGPAMLGWLQETEFIDQRCFRKYFLTEYLYRHYSHGYLCKYFRGNLERNGQAQYPGRKRYFRRCYYR